MGRFDYEKKGTRWGGPGGAKGKKATPDTQFRNQCDHCGATLPCNRSGCRKASAAARRNPAPAAAKKQVLKRGQKSSIKKAAMDAYRNAHPTASDSQVKRQGARAVRIAKRKLK